MPDITAIAALPRLDIARKLLAEEDDPAVLKASLAQVAAEETLREKLGQSEEAIYHAQEIKVLIQRRLGEVLSAMKRAGELAIQGRPEKVQRQDLLGPPRRLADLGISKNESSQLQALAALPEQQVEERITALKAAQQPVTATRVLSPPSTQDIEAMRRGAERFNAEYEALPETKRRNAWMRAFRTYQPLLMATYQWLTPEMFAEIAPHESMIEDNIRTIQKWATDCLAQLHDRDQIRMVK